MIYCSYLLLSKQIVQKIRISSSQINLALSGCSCDTKFRTDRLLVEGIMGKDGKINFNNASPINDFHTFEKQCNIRNEVKKIVSRTEWNRSAGIDGKGKVAACFGRASISMHKMTPRFESLLLTSSPSFPTTPALFNHLCAYCSPVLKCSDPFVKFGHANLGAMGLLREFPSFTWQTVEQLSSLQLTCQSLILTCAIISC